MTTPNPVVKVGSVEIGNAKPLSIIAGPCAMESRDHALEMAIALKDLARKAGVGLIYKTSFDQCDDLFDQFQLRLVRCSDRIQLHISAAARGTDQG